MGYSPATLGIILSKLSKFDQIHHKDEQYATPSQIAADFLYAARLHVKGKHVLDLGAGTGILSIGALLMGAASVTSVEKNVDAISVFKKNVLFAQKEFAISVPKIIEGDVCNTSFSAYDTVIMNPPFGTKQKGVDVLFLEKAFGCASVVFSMHKTSTITHIKNVGMRNEFTCVYEKHVQFPIPKTHERHEKPVKFIDVACVGFVKK